MYKSMVKNNKFRLASLLGAVAIVFLVLWGCGGGASSYDAVSTGPVLTQTATASIEAPDLKVWMDQGLVNAATGEKVVILDVKDQATYDTGHIPGAVRVDSGEIMITRLEGVAEFPSMVTDGPHMDAIIQRAGIDAHTTIVFTSTSLMNACRIYATFRYWGFPKSQLKVLNGVDTAWKAAGYPVDQLNTPKITPSSYCVTPNGVNRVQAQIRASLGEMMDLVANYDGTKHVIIDTLHSPGYAAPAGTTTGLSPVAVAGTKEYVVFEGYMNNAVMLPQSSLYTGNAYYPADDGTPASLKSKFNAVGMDETKTAYVHCRAGNAASIEFFALDGILNWNVVWYDGSWGQWGQMADIKGGKLKAGSIWSTYPLTTAVNYNQDSGLIIQPYSYYKYLDDIFTTVTDPRANQIEKADTEYKSPLSSSSGGSSGGSSSGGGC
jgi:3-mercaptopyruvate sulfurtransferase SseA